MGEHLNSKCRSVCCCLLETAFHICRGVNRFNMELINEENSLIRNVYSLNIVRRLPIDGNGQIGLQAGSVTAISSQRSTNYVPANVVDGVLAPKWFADSADTPDWERQAVSLASAAGIIEVRVRTISCQTIKLCGGCGDGTAENVEF